MPRPTQAAYDLSDTEKRDIATQTGLKVERSFGVCSGPRRYEYDGLRVLPVADFLTALHQGEVFKRALRSFAAPPGSNLCSWTRALLPRRQNEIRAEAA